MINPMSKQRHVHILVLCLFEFLLIPDSMSIHQNDFISRTIVEENDTIQRCQNPIQLMPSTRYALFKPLPLPQADTDLGVGALSAGTPPPPFFWHRWSSPCSDSNLQLGAFLPLIHQCEFSTSFLSIQIKLEFCYEQNLYGILK
jgi:hypothetical protein